MNLKLVAIGAALIAATTALAHEGVKNPVVKARMDGMSAIADRMKTLGQMSKGAVDFNAEVARAAAASIAKHAAATPGLFEANEADPKDEAKPEIWTNFDDFTAKAVELEKIAAGFATAIDTPEDLTAAMGALGANCKSCHSIYRE